MDRVASSRVPGILLSSPCHQKYSHSVVTQLFTWMAGLRAQALMFVKQPLLDGAVVPAPILFVYVIQLNTPFVIFL